MKRVPTPAIDNRFKDTEDPGFNVGLFPIVVVPAYIQTYVGHNIVRIALEKTRMPKAI
jgi:hypothetical protein